MSKPFDMYSWRRKYIYLAESDKQFPDYDPNKHKTLMRGAIDYDLEGDNIVAYLPFEEEAENAVRVVVPKAHLEQFLGDEIYDNEDLQAYNSDRIYDFFHNKWSGMFGKYDQMKNEMSESESMTEDAESVDEAYYEVLALIRQKARKLNDDDAYKFHELLKGFFNRLLQEDKNTGGYNLGQALFKLQDEPKETVEEFKAHIAKNSEKYAEFTVDDFVQEYEKFKNASKTENVDMLDLYERYLKKY